MKNIFKIWILFLMLVSCTSEPKDAKVKSIKSIDKTEFKSEVLQPPSTVKMIALLKDVYSQIDPSKINYFANGRRAEMMRSAMEIQSDPSKKVLLKMRYGLELIRAGKNENAIIVLEQVVSKMKANPRPNLVNIYQANRALAIAYLRVGEVQNCVNNESESMCIMPFDKEAVYKDKRSVKMAISILNEMLSIASTEKEAIWLLNFAHMANGSYPDQVPSKYLMPLSSFDSDYQIEKFKNIGAEINANINGLAGGAIMDDFNNDGYLDLISTSWGEQDGIQYLENNGKDKLVNQTAESGLLGLLGGLNINQVDYNNDGLLDFFVMRGAWYSSSGQIPNSLLRNDGDGLFTDVTEELGLLSFYPTQTSIWQDFNLDGRIDLFIANEGSKQIPCNNELFIQQKNGTFINVISQVEGLNRSAGFAKGCAAGDINNDGLVDIYFSYCGQPNKLFVNTSSKGILSFSDISIQANVSEPLKSFPTWFWDYNNDGYDDILVADFGDYNIAKASYVLDNYLGNVSGSQPRIYLNNKDNTFTDQSVKMGITDAIFAMGSNFGDIDNDGYLDFYLATGSPNFTSIFPNRMFRNNQGKEFQDVTTAGGFGHIQKGHGVAFGDIDNDGDQDVFNVLGGAYEGDVAKDALFLNPGNEHMWVCLKLVGAESNRAAIGARLQVKYTDENGRSLSQFHTVSSGSSFGANSLQVECGLGRATKIDEVLITWPNLARKKSIVKDLELNTFYTIYELNDQVEKLELRKINF